jgi:hypothetical protein
LKKQASQQNVEYNRLADEHNRTVSPTLNVGQEERLMIDWFCFQQEGRLSRRRMTRREETRWRRVNEDEVDE